MEISRRSRITDLLKEGKTDTEILDVLNREFLPGSYATSNKQALSGTKRDLEHSSTPVTRKKPASSAPAQINNPTPLQRDELVDQLRSFRSEPVIERYQQRDLAGKSLRELLKFTVDRTIYRAFHHETPSKRYARWRWHDNAELLLQNLDGIGDQETFDRFAIEIGESLVADWGEKNDLGEPGRMNIGVAMKITNLALKHVSFSDHSRNPGLTEWLHVPWDSFTLRPLRNIWAVHPVIPKNPSQGFVKNLDMYQQLHSLITDITEQAGVSRITYEFWAWDTAH